MRGDSPIDVFPDPMPNEVDVMLHYKPGSDPEETFLPSILKDVEKSYNNITFSPITQTVESLGFVITWVECSKPRLLH